MNDFRKATSIFTFACLSSLIGAGCASDRYPGTRTPQGRHAESTNTGDSTNGSYSQNTGTGGSSMDTAYVDSSYGDTGSFRNNPGTGGSNNPGTGGSNYPGTGGSDGSGVGGGSMPDSGFNDSLGIYGPTGSWPGDTGVGGGIPPGPDTLWGDTLAPPDTDAYPDGRANRALPPGGDRSNM
jgi:hypothetical protein